MTLDLRLVSYHKIQIHQCLNRSPIHNTNDYV